MSKKLDALLKRGFKASKCKTLLKLSVSRIKLLRNKRSSSVKLSRRDIAQLLQTGQENSAWIRIEHVFREENLLTAYDLIEQYCELVVNRLPIIDSQKHCPVDVKEAVSSLIFAAPRCADLLELQQVREAFTAKYGKEFAIAAAELRPDCGVNRQIIEKLSSHAPDGKAKLKLMKEIAAEHKIEWDAEKSQLQLLKQPAEDVLDGPKKFSSASQVSIAEVPVIFKDPKNNASVSKSTDNLGAISSGQGQASQVHVPSSPPLSPSSSSSRMSDNDASPVRGKFPPPGKYDSLPRTDPYTSSRMEDALDFEDSVSYARVKDKDRIHSQGSPAALAQFESHFSEPKGAVSSPVRKPSEAVAHATRGSISQYADVASAAQAAFESAALAAAAARAAVDLAKNESKARFSKNKSGSESEEELNSLRIIGSKEAGQSTENNSRSVSSKLDASSNYIETIDTLDEVGGLSASSDSAAGLLVRKQISSEYSEPNNRPGKRSDSNDEVEQISSPTWKEVDTVSETGFLGTKLKEHVQTSESDDEVEQVSSPGWKLGDTLSDAGFLGTQLKEHDDSHDFEGPRFDDYDDKEVDDGKLNSPWRRAHFDTEDLASSTGNNLFSNWSKQSGELSRQDKSSYSTEEGLDGGEEWDFGRRFGTRMALTTKNTVETEKHAFEGKVHLGKPNFDDYLDSDEVQERNLQTSHRTPLQSRNRPQVNPKNYWQVDNAGRDTDSELDIPAVKRTSYRPDVLNVRKLRWNSTVSEESNFSSQSNEVKSKDSEDLSVKQVFPVSDEGEDYNEGLNGGIQKHKGERTEPNSKDGTDSLQTVKPKPQYGESRRSVRSVRTRQAKQPSPSSLIGLEREDTSSTLTSKFEDVQAKTRHQKHSPHESPVYASRPAALEWPGKNTRHKSPSSSDLSSLPSPFSKSTHMILTTSNVPIQQTFLPNQDSERKFPDLKISPTDSLKGGSDSKPATYQNLPDYDEFNARFQALRRKR